jgi:hypothetical protein
MLFGFENPLAFIKRKGLLKETPEKKERKKPSPETSKIVDGVMAERIEETDPDSEKINKAYSQLEKETNPDTVTAIEEEAETLRSPLSSMISKHPTACKAIAGTMLGLTLMGSLGANKAEAGGHYGGPYGGHQEPHYSDVLSQAGKGAVGVAAGTAVMVGIATVVDHFVLKPQREEAYKQQAEMMQRQQIMMERQRAMQIAEQKIRMLEMQRQQALNNINRARNDRELEFAQKKLNVIETAIETEKAKMGQ